MPQALLERALRTKRNIGFARDLRTGSTSPEAPLQAAPRAAGPSKRRLPAGAGAHGPRPSRRHSGRAAARLCAASSCPPPGTFPPAPTPAPRGAPRPDLGSLRTKAAARGAAPKPVPQVPLPPPPPRPEAGSPRAMAAPRGTERPPCCRPAACANFGEVSFPASGGTRGRRRRGGGGGKAARRPAGQHRDARSRSECGGDERPPRIDTARPPRAAPGPPAAPRRIHRAR